MIEYFKLWLDLPLLGIEKKRSEGIVVEKKFPLSLKVRKILDRTSVFYQGAV